MRPHTPIDRRTDRKTTDSPDTYALASELGVDATLLDRFVDEHPNPTAPIVLAWAFDRGELPRSPEALRDDVEAWLDGRTRPPASHLTEEELRKSGVQADALRQIIGGEV